MLGGQARYDGRRFDNWSHPRPCGRSRRRRELSELGSLLGYDRSGALENEYENSRGLLKKDGCMHASSTPSDLLLARSLPHPDLRLLGVGAAHEEDHDADEEEQADDAADGDPCDPTGAQGFGDSGGCVRG